MSTRFPAPLAREAQIAGALAEFYQHAETHELVARVEAAAELLRTRGAETFIVGFGIYVD